jgi:hypothetical protein
MHCHDQSFATTICPNFFKVVFYFKTQNNTLIFLNLHSGDLVEKVKNGGELKHVLGGLKLNIKF